MLHFVFVFGDAEMKVILMVQVQTVILGGIAGEVYMPAASGRRPG